MFTLQPILKQKDQRVYVIKIITYISLTCIKGQIVTIRMGDGKHRRDNVSMTNMIMIKPGTSTSGCDDHLVVTAHFKDNLHVAELFTENGRTISGITTLGQDGSFDSKWERCPGALKGEVVYHKKAGIEPRNDKPKVAGNGYCSGYHKTVWAKKNPTRFANQPS